jgi:hypothetical protein
MDDIDWYAEAALASDEHVYCAGSLAQCVRRWKRLSDVEKDLTIIELKQGPRNMQRLRRDQIAPLADNPALMRV